MCDLEVHATALLETLMDFQLILCKIVSIPKFRFLCRLVLLASVHRGCAVDYIGDAAPRQHDLLERGIVEDARDVEVEVLLVSFDGGFERVVEFIGEIRRRRRVRNVTEAFKVRL